jgi:hypothetical protein
LHETVFEDHIIIPENSANGSPTSELSALAILQLHTVGIRAINDSELISNGIMFIPSFVEIGQMVQ